MDCADEDFVFEMGFFYPIQSIDAFIANGDLAASAKAQLLSIRHDALQAFKAGNFSLSEAHTRALDNACRIAGMLEAAKTGAKFQLGRKSLTGGPIRKAIARLLAKSPGMKNPELWEAIKMKPPRGWQVFDNRAGKYIEGPKSSKGMNYARFCNVAAEERRVLKEQKNHGLANP